MNHEIPWDAPLESYESAAHALLEAARGGSDAARWRFRWEHPRFETIHQVRAATLDSDDARVVVARQHAFESWADLVAFTRAAKAADGPVAAFERAADAVVSGDAGALRALLAADAALPRARSVRRHRATLLHYVAANGVEGVRQETPPNAVEIARMLLDAGAGVDALAHMYDRECTTMGMLVSSAHPHRAGLQAALAETLLDHGAALDGPGTEGSSALLTALAFGYRDTAEVLVRRGARVDTLVKAAGLGRVDDAKRLLPAADGKARHAALALAAQHGHAEMVEMLIDAGEDPSRYNPDGFHAHATPLHQAVLASHEPVARLLVERGARLDLRDTIYDGTPLDWAEYAGRTQIAEYLRERGAA